MTLPTSETIYPTSINKNFSMLFKFGRKLPLKWIVPTVVDQTFTPHLWQEPHPLNRIETKIFCIFSARLPQNTDLITAN